MSRDEMILAGCRVKSPAIFKHGLNGLPSDGPKCRKAMAETIREVTAIVDAALSALEAAGYVVVPKADLEWRDWNDEEIAALPHNGSFPILVMEPGDNPVWLAPGTIGQPCDPWFLTDEEKTTFVWRPVITSYERAMLSAAQQEKTDAG